MKKLLWSLLCVLLLAVTACSKKTLSIPDPDPVLPPEPTIELTDEASQSLHFTAEGGEQVVAFAVSGDWTATVADDAAWCNVAPATGKAGEQQMTVTAQANESTAGRTTAVTLACSTAVVTISVTQEGEEPDSLEMEGLDENGTKSLHFTAEGGAEAVSFTASGDWTAAVSEDAAWCHVDPAAGEAGEKNITISTDPSEIKEVRTTTVTLQCGTATITITVTQDGMDWFDFGTGDGEGGEGSSRTLHFAAEGGSESVEFSVSGDWTATVADDAAWCSVTPASGEAGAQKITVTAQANEAKEERITTITLECGSAIVTISVTQEGNSSDSSGIPSDMELAFPDPIFRQYVLDNFDKDKNGKISEEEALAVTRISVNSMNIASLEGIQYFTNLTILTCELNQLTELDVSQNTALTDLTCNNNQLTTLDVSKNTALTELDCYSTSLTMLDVSQNTALTILDCHYNQLTELDVSQNTALTYLACDSNQLTELDVSQNTALTFLDCHYNQLTELDVSQNTALTTLYCYSNQLTTLDVSQNTALTWLYCGNNQLTTLDVSQNAKLIHLYCEDNQLTALDVSKNTKLIHLYCYGNQLTELDVSKTDLRNSLYNNDGHYLFPLDCSPMETLQTVYLKKGWSIRNITEDFNRSSKYIPDQTEIVFVD